MINKIEIYLFNVIEDSPFNDKNYKFKVDKSYGHISHAKLLNINIILIFLELNKCEIRNIEKNFESINSFTHIGDEIYTIDFIIMIIILIIMKI